MLDAIKHVFHQKGRFLCTLGKAMFLCKPTSEHYYLNPEAQSALYLGKHTHKILLLPILNVRHSLDWLNYQRTEDKFIKARRKIHFQYWAINPWNKLKWEDSLDHDKTPFWDARFTTLVQMENLSDLAYLPQQKSHRPVRKVKFFKILFQCWQSVD